MDDVFETIMPGVYTIAGFFLAILILGMIVSRHIRMLVAFTAFLVLCGCIYLVFDIVVLPFHQVH